MFDHRVLCFLCVLFVGCVWSESTHPKSVLRTLQERCLACDLMVQIARKELLEKPYPEAHAYLSQLSADYNFVRSLPDFGGRLDGFIVQAGKELLNKFSYEKFTELETEDTFPFCESLGMCNSEYFDASTIENQCADCAEGCCTTFGACICGNDMYKRLLVSEDHPLVDIMTQDNYVVFLTKEEIKKKREENREKMKDIPFPKVDHNAKNTLKPIELQNTAKGSKTTAVPDDMDTQKDII